MPSPPLDAVFVDRRVPGHATHRLRFVADGTVRSDWFDWGHDDRGGARPNDGTYTWEGDTIRVRWADRSPWLHRLIRRFLRRRPSAVEIEYRLHRHQEHSYLVHARRLAQFERWLAAPHTADDRLPDGVYLAL